ncbi:aromatic ring-hydroxylating dioxygenase subunit alpha [Noviherbaspirillum sedimenti]|uniref:Aromatic ring-hydroxylating dioxygenase subunit alpha n=1 Tax=Noviherbaspirillum sedimenti TaxID=2320865 RepID=A0A3A3G3Q5_9BURK|nr:aromatic ring-hydroxylating dioxygenase subunit alpha [Noviherbaspirillum sedimenti]RJG02571.1 aromatic ring-hydroxylating dioxygenase subunit alpha [Noviherbaspirillum sedimenti]
MFIKNCWYVAGWDKEVPQDGFLSRTIANMPLAIWRDSHNKVIAFEDRCCHRGAPLSKGRREGDCVRCMYHGLKFDVKGICIEIPSQPRIPPQAKVRVFPVVEKHRWIWIWLGDPSLADESLIPDTHWLDDPAWRSNDGYIHYDVNYLLIADNLLDFSHLPYVHPTTLGGTEDYAKVQPKVERTDRGVKITRWALNIDPPAFVQKVHPFEGKVDRWNIYDFIAPGILLMDSGMAPAGTGAPEGNRVNAVEFRGCQALSPEHDNSTHYFFAHPHNFAIDRPDVTDSIHQSVVTAFDEDREIVEAQQAMVALDPNFKMVNLGIDAALSQFRWIVSRAIEQENKSAEPA